MKSGPRPSFWIDIAISLEAGANVAQIVSSSVKPDVFLDLATFLFLVKFDLDFMDSLDYNNKLGRYE